MGTSTSRFGVGKREGHDATEFYARFRPPEISADAEVADFTPDPPLICGDSRAMDDLKPASVALVVTSPQISGGSGVKSVTSASAEISGGRNRA